MNDNNNDTEKQNNWYENTNWNKIWRQTSSSPHRAADEETVSSVQSRTKLGFAGAHRGKSRVFAQLARGWVAGMGKQRRRFPRVI